MCVHIKFSSSAVIVAGSQEPPWAVASPPVRVTSTSCVHVPRAARSSRTGRFTATNTETWWLQRCEFICCQIINIYFCWKHYTYLLLYSDFVFVMLTIVCDSSQIVSGKGFEVPRRVYVDFNGINLRRKFLTGLEPESINMTIGKIILMFHVFDSCNGIDSDWIKIRLLYVLMQWTSLFVSFLPSRLAADSETWCSVRAVIKWEDAVSCRLSVSDNCLSIQAGGFFWLGFFCEASTASQTATFEL